MSLIEENPQIITANVETKDSFVKKSRFVIVFVIALIIIGMFAGGIIFKTQLDESYLEKDMKAQEDVSMIGRSAEDFATIHNNFYPRTISDLLVGSGKLKILPSSPDGYPFYVFESYDSFGSRLTCVSGLSCVRVIVSGVLKSQNYKDTPFWNYDTSTAKSCAAQSPIGGCP